MTLLLWERYFSRCIKKEDAFCAVLRCRIPFFSFVYSADGFSRCSNHEIISCRNRNNVLAWQAYIRGI